MRKRILVATILASIGVACFAQTAANEQHHIVVRPRDLKWVPMQLPGAEMAVVSGDPSKAGEFVIRIKCANGVKIPPHWHPADEHILVMRGVFSVGSGILYDDTKLEDLQAGIYVLMPKGMRHFALSKGETVVQVHGIGPFVINWVNPADVPQAPKQ